MMSRRVRGRYVVGLCLLAAACGAGRAAAQDGLGNEKALKDEFSNNRIRFDNLLTGTAAYDAKADKAISETAARFSVYQFTWRDTYRKTAPRSPQGLANEFQQRMKLAADQSPKNQVFMDVFAKDLVDAFKNALKSLKLEDQRQQCVHVALLLPLAAQCKNELFGDYLAELVADPKQHAVYRLYAVRGLREFFPVVLGKDPAAKTYQDRRTRALKRVDAAQAYIFQKWEFTPGIKEEVDAVIYQRRDGVRTLAQAEVPAVEVEKDNVGVTTKVHGPVAVALMRVLTKGSLTPPVSLAERAEAAIGVCKFKAQGIESYRSDLAVALVGRLLLDFTEQYVVDYNASISTKKIPVLPWRVYAERLTEALKDFQKYSPRDSEVQRKAQEQIKELVAKATPLLDTIKALRSVEAPAELRDFVQTLQPGTTTVFEGVPDTNLKGGQTGKGG